MKKLVLGSMLTLGISGIMFGQAATQSETTTTDVNKGFFSNVGLVLDTETVNQHLESDKKGGMYQNDIITVLTPQLSYKLGDKDKVTFESRSYLSTATRNLGKKDDTLKLIDDYVGFRYDRSSILTQADNGVDLSVSIRGNVKLSEDARSRNHNRSTFNPRATLTYKASPSFSVENEGRIYLNDVDNVNSTIHRKIIEGRLFVRPRYNLTDSFALNGEAYYNTAYGKNGGRANFLRLRPGFEVTVTEKMKTRLFSEHYFGYEYSTNTKARAMSQYYDMRNNDMALYSDFEYSFSKNLGATLELSTLVMKDGKIGRGAPIGQYYAAEIDLHLVAF